MTRPHLVPCATCTRHVRVNEEVCPFCRSSRPASLRETAPPRGPAARLSRAALYAFGALGTGTIGTGSPGCSSPTVIAPYGLSPSFPDSNDAGDAGDSGRPSQQDGAREGGDDAAHGSSPGDEGDASAAADSLGATDGGHVIVPPYGVPPGP